jgi:hypothetical protein
VEEDRIFIIDGPVWTSAGMTAGIDLALAMIEQDLDRMPPGLWRDNWSFIIAAPAANRSSLHC